jgi:hypothetical protein
MRLAYSTYKPADTIPIDPYLKNKKLKKYFNRETGAAIATIGRLLSLATVDPPSTPLYYVTGLLEYEDYGLDAIARNSLGSDSRFSLRRFIDTGIAGISPLNQFKVLLNMPLCFIAIEHGFRGDNAVIYSSVFGLLTCALFGPECKSLIIGSGKTFADGTVETGFALTDKEELHTLKVRNPQEEAFLLFRELSKENSDR